MGRYPKNRINSTCGERGLGKTGILVDVGIGLYISFLLTNSAKQGLKSGLALFVKSNMEKQLRFAVGIMGNCTSLLMYMSPVLTFVKVIKEKSVGQYSCTPYVIALLNCFTYTWYGMPVVSKGFENILVSTVNGAGIIPECFVICTYLVFAPPKARLKVLMMLIAVIVLFIIMAMVSTFALHEHKTRKCLVGIVGIISSIAMYGSPLGIMKLVIRTKSVEYMPFYLSFFSFVTSTLWMTYGVLSKDALLAAPNVIGSPLGMAQLILYCIYRKNKKTCISESNLNPEDPVAGIESRVSIQNGHKTKPPREMKVELNRPTSSRKDNHANHQSI